MSYLSANFAIFVLVLMVGCYLFPSKWRWVLLLAGSLVFYGCFDLKYLPFLLFTALSTWFGAVAVRKTGKKKLVLTVCIAVNVVLWLAVKELP